MNIIFLVFTDYANIDQVQTFVEYLLRLYSDAATNKNGVGENSLVQINLSSIQESTVSQNIQNSQSSSQTNEIPAEGRILKGIQNNSVE